MQFFPDLEHIIHLLLFIKQSLFNEHNMNIIGRRISFEEIKPVHD